MIRVNNKYNIGEIVYLVTDPDQLRRIVVGVLIKQTGIMYDISQCATSQYYYDFELSDTSDTVMKVTQ